MVTDFSDLSQRVKTPSKKKTLSQINAFMRMVMWLCVGISGALITVCAVAYIANSAVFHVRHIDIRGAAQVKTDEVLTLLDIEQGDNILSWDMTEARKRLQTHPWIKNAVISRGLVPASITVTLIEHRAAATLFLKDRPYLISQEGQVFASSPDTYYGIMIKAQDYSRQDMKQGFEDVLSAAIASSRLVQSRGLMVSGITIEPGGLVDIELKNGIILTIFGEMTPLKMDMAIKTMAKLKPAEGTVMDLRCDDKVVLRNRGAHGSEG